MQERPTLDAVTVVRSKGATALGSKPASAAPIGPGRASSGSETLYGNWVSAHSVVTLSAAERSLTFGAEPNPSRNSRSIGARSPWSADRTEPG